jgi:hypothetical protein
MRLDGSRCRRHLAWAFWAWSVGGCSVYEGSPPGASGGAAGAGDTTATTGTTTHPTSASSTGASDTTAAATGSSTGGASGETVTTGAAGSGGDPGSGGAAGEGGGTGGNAGSAAGAGAGGSAIVDASTNDASGQGGSGAQEAEANSSLPPQTLPQHGVATLTNLAVPFTSPCNADEVVIGFSIRAGAWTDAIGSICSKFQDGMLGAIRILPLNGKPDGGNPQQMLCPTNFIAAGVVGNYGHSNRFNVDEMTGLGVVCRDIANSANVQVVAIAQTPLDMDGGMIAFREDCAGPRWLTSMTGMLDNNAVSGQSVVRFGGECNSR